MDSNTKRIPLSRPKRKEYAIVDAGDYEWLNRHFWHFTAGYAARYEPGKTTRMHREVLEMHDIVIPQGYLVDHINHDPLDNRLLNLRICTLKQNAHNSRARTGDYKGVCFFKQCKTWLVNITADYRQYSLGYYQSEHVAAQVYNEGAKRLHGDFAFQNEVPEEHRVDVSRIIDIDAVIYGGLKPKDAKKLAQSRTE